MTRIRGSTPGGAALTSFLLLLSLLALAACSDVPAPDGRFVPDDDDIATDDDDTASDDDDSTDCADEVCNGLDDDCDGIVPADELDADGDGVAPCVGDCDDGDPAVSPLSSETCNGMDDDCDGIVDDGFDLDGDGFTTCDGDCDDSDALTHAQAIERCDGVDNDCDSVLPSIEADLDGDGVARCDGDCDDTRADVRPGGVEVPDDGLDQDCTGADATTCWSDGDGDGYGTGAPLVVEPTGDCLSAGLSPNDIDCDDSDATVWPGELSPENDGVDHDCDGTVTYELALGPVSWWGEGDGDWAGYNLASAGDMDGDGLPDLLVGAYNHGGASQNGAVYVLFSSTQTPGSRSLAAADVRIEGLPLQSVGRRLGSGDLDGDGLGDLLLGAIADDTHAENGGAVYGFLGTQLTGGASLTTAAAHFVIPGQLQLQVGSSMAVLGDLNGDGFSEVAVGARGGLPTIAGAAYVFEGSRLAQGGTVSLSEAATTIVGQAGDSLADSMAVGDFDGDGVLDLVVSGGSFDAPGLNSAGAVGIWSGAQLLATPTHGSADAWSWITGDVENADIGTEVAASDLDGDGISELLIGAEDYPIPGTGIDGRAFWVSAADLAGGVSSVAQATTTFDGEFYETRAGASVGTIGDVDGDGLREVLVAAPEYGPLVTPGIVYILPGSIVTSGGPLSLESAPWEILGVPFGFTGTSMVVQDSDGDGNDDVWLGAPHASGTFVESGVVRLLEGPL